MIRYLDKRETEVYWAWFLFNQAIEPIHSFHSGWFKLPVVLYSEEYPSIGADVIDIDDVEYQLMVQWLEDSQ